MRVFEAVNPRVHRYAINLTYIRYIHVVVILGHLTGPMRMVQSEALHQ